MTKIAIAALLFLLIPIYTFPLALPASEGITVTGAEAACIYGGCSYEDGENQRTVCYGGDCQAGGCGCKDLPGIKNGEYSVETESGIVCGTSACTTSEEMVQSGEYCDG